MKRLAPLLLGLALAGTARARPASPLTAGLRGPWTEVSTTFDARVRRQFPVGTSEAALSQALSRQGFRRVNASGPEQEAVRREDNFACNIAARVFWTAGPDRRIHSIRGEYRQEGCL